MSAAKQDLVVAFGMIMKDLTPMLLQFYGLGRSTMAARRATRGLSTVVIGLI